jgi:transcriptional regulator with XRE-family HTH domain
MLIGELIREIRREQGKTLEDVAFAADTDAGNLSRIERGQQRYSSDVLERIALALGIAVSDIYLRLEQGGCSLEKPAQPTKRVKKERAVDDLLQSRFDRLNHDNQALVLDFIQLLLRNQGKGEDLLDDSKREC